MLIDKIKNSYLHIVILHVGSEVLTVMVSLWRVPPSRM
jgi:hypothetical protein